MRLLGLMLAGVLLTGCGVQKPVGVIFTDIDVPTMNPTTNSVGSKVGTAECVSYLSVVALGDCSVETAAKNGGISRISTVDTKVNSILGIINTFVTTVTGE